MHKIFSRIKYIFLESDLSMSSLIFGMSLMLWGMVAIMIGHVDLLAFAGPTKTIIANWIWALNYIVLGACFITVAILNHPSLLTMLVGAYASLVWTWIASIRQFPVLTSGVTLNIFVVLMGVLLIVRSRKK